MAQLTILEGSTFCISDELGDLSERTHGLFAVDTRFLSRLRLTIDGKRPLLLSSGTVEYFSAAFFLRNPLTDTLPLDSVSVRRERFVGDGMQDHVVLQNETMNPLELTLGVEFGADFADILSVKAWDFSLGDPTHAKPLPEPVEIEIDEAGNQFVLTDRDGFGRTQVILSRRGGTPTGAGVVYDVKLKPRQRWELRVDVHRRPPRQGVARSARRQPALRRGACARARVVRGLAPPRAAHQGELGRPRARLRTVGERPRRAPDADR